MTRYQSKHSDDLDMLLIEHLFFLHEICVRRRSRAIKDLSNLLQAPTLRLWIEEILDSEENDQQTAKDYAGWRSIRS